MTYSLDNGIIKTGEVENSGFKLTCSFHIQIALLRRYSKGDSHARSRQAVRVLGKRNEAIYRSAFEPESGAGKQCQNRKGF